MPISKKNNTDYLTRFFNSNLENSDKELHESIQNELNRQQNHIELIAPENILK